MSNSDQQLQFVIKLARTAGEMAADHYGDLQVDCKPDGTLATNADKETEQLIRTTLLSRWPDDMIIGEELLGAHDLSTGRVWCVDPIDGTHNFIRGLPLWAVSIGLCSDGIPVLGVVHSPGLGLTFAAAQGQGASCNEQPIIVADNDEVVRSDLIALTTEASKDLRLQLHCSQRNLGSAALHACYVASGTFVAALFSQWKVWDLAAGLCIAAEAGAVACDLQGRRMTSLAALDAQGPHEPLILAPERSYQTIAANVRYVSD